MEIIPIEGFIEDKSSADGKRYVAGYAFQVPSMEFFHVWATRSIDYVCEGKDWVVSHWETGMTVGAWSGVRGSSPQDAAEKAISFLLKKGKKAIRRRMKELKLYI